MSRIINALKNAQEKKSEGGVKNKEFNVNNILSSAAISKKRFSPFKNVALFVIVIGLILLGLAAFFVLSRGTVKDEAENVTARQARRNAGEGDNNNFGKITPEKQMQTAVPPDTTNGEPQKIAMETAAKSEEVRGVTEPKEAETMISDQVGVNIPDGAAGKELSKITPAEELQVRVPPDTASNEPQKIAVETTTKSNGARRELDPISERSGLEKDGGQFPALGETISGKADPEQEVGGSELSIESKTPESAVYYFNLGLFYQGEKNLERAKSEYEKVIAIDQFNVEAHNNLGMVYKDMGKLNKSIDAYKKALSIDSEYQKAYYNLAVAYYHNGNIQAAMTEARLAISIDSKDVESYNLLCLCYKKINKHMIALKLMQDALAIDPEHAQSHYNTAVLLEDVERYEEAAFHFQKFITFADSGSSQQLIAKVRNHLGQSRFNNLR